MLTIDELKSCLEDLSIIDTYGEAHNARAHISFLHIHALLSKEINFLMDMERAKENRDIRRGNIDVKKLIEDNVQLCMENEKLRETCVKLKEEINDKIPNLINSINHFNNNLNQLK